MKLKTYKINLKKHPQIEYIIDAPSKRIAKWCAVCTHNNNYMTGITVKDVVIQRHKWEDE